MDKILRQIIGDMQILKSKVDKLEKDSHPLRDFVVCNKCKKPIKEKHNGTKTNS